ncbi:alpha/beta-hydrolase [Aureobasidium pullulans]|uniref:Carboxylic ester hydrolase n=1 Tax=Aureobasidium pullulans TaxID=5580 RepID=A0A4S8SL13_AURPU|nr:alpha/beta-hydrolase [Aureobasidium pullulans]
MLDQSPFSVATAALVLTFSGLGNAALYGTEIPTKYGNVVGYPAFNSTPAGNLTQWKNIAVWKGIPFAATTAGNNRFRAPQPAEPWNSTLYAKDFGNVCPNAVQTGGFSSSDYTIDENCLNLNIWSAANSSDAKLPVVMWSYPAESTAADPLFDGGGMADKNVVYVNYNYRTGAFGWLSHPELSVEVEALTGHNSSGNWGMLDQFAALKWIHENIAAFGGDPDHITVMGQSAGSAATQHILNSPLTKGLIVGAIIESGVRYPRDPLSTSAAEAYITLEESLEQGVRFLEYLNVTTIEEARALPYSDLVTSLATLGSTSEWTFEACLDYYAMPGTYLDTLLMGSANQVPVLTGNTKDESGATYGLNISVAEYLTDLNETYSPYWVERFLELYPASDNFTASGAYNSQFTDRSKIGTFFWTQLWMKASSQPVWNYFWNHAPPGQSQGAFHESEINYVLNNLYDTTQYTWETIDYAIAATMNSYWVNFIKYGNPNGQGLNYWPAVCKENPSVQIVGNSFNQSALLDPAKIKLFAEWFSTLEAY